MNELGYHPSFAPLDPLPILIQNALSTPLPEVTRMSFFPDVNKIKFEGPDSKNPLGFRHYHESEIVDASR